MKRIITLFLLACLCITQLTAQNTLDKVGLTSATPAATAYSLRLLSSSYTGPLVRITIGSNYYDVYPDANTKLFSLNSTVSAAYTTYNASATGATANLLNSVIGSNSATVAIWYDQSGNAINMSQATTATQPQIINAGAINTLNGKPALVFGTAKLATAKTVIFSAGASMVGVAKGNSTTSSSFITKTGTSADANNNYPGPFDFTNTNNDLAVGNASTLSYTYYTLPPSSVINSAASTGVYSFVIPTSGTFYSYRNGIETSNKSVAGYQDGGNSMMIGNRNDGQGSGSLTTPEIILFNAAISSTNRQIIELNQAAVYINNPILTISGTTTLSVSGTTTLAIPSLPTGGNSTATSGYFKLHSFTSTGSSSFALPSGISANVAALVVAGGGAGGNNGGGGGGGGGVLYTSSYIIAAAGSVSTTVGSGGTVAANASTTSFSGGNSVFGTVTATGGGGGASRDGGGAALSGGSGGGGSGASGFNTGALNAGSGTSGQGNNGGNGAGDYGCNSAGGGGGGASSAGNAAASNTGGAGGAGIAYNFTGTAVTYAGGGGGGLTCNTGGTGGAGGSGGGGNGGSAATATAGTANTGSGGGGSGTGNAGGAGGSGVVLVRYTDFTGGTWSSSNTAVATVNSSSGVVTGVSAGTATINYVSSNGLVIASNTVTVLSNDATLSALTISSGTLAPTFATATTSYTASVGNAIASVTVTPTKSDPNATIQVRVNSGTYATVTSGSASSALNLNVGTNTIDVTVTAQDGTTTKTYTTTVTRSVAVTTITSFSPTTGVVGATVTITGANFNTTAANNIVYFGGVKAATPSAATATSLTVTVPSGANYGPVTVLNTATQLSAYSKGFFSTTKAPVKTSLSSGDFASRANFSLGGGTWAMTASEGDFNNDGLIDVAVTDYNNASGVSIKVFPNSSTAGTISFGTAVNLSAQAGTRGLSSADLDGDGKLELISVTTGTAAVSIFPNTSSGGTISFGTRVSLTINGGAYYALAADFNGDGKIDIACANNNVVSVFLNTTTTVGTITFATKVDFTATGCLGLGVGDIDGDGLPDLVTGNSNSSTVSVSVLRNTTSAPASLSFANKVDFATGSATSQYLNLADFDGDGKLDVAVTNGNSRSTSLFRNTTSGSTINFATPSTLAGSFSVLGLAVGDINGDGLPEVVTSDGGNWYLYLNNSTSGTFNFSSGVALSPGGGPWDASIADLDGDGRADIFGGNGGTDLAVYRSAPTFSSNANLSALSISSGTLAPTFATATTSYTANVGNAIASVTVTPTKSDANATIQVKVNNGSYSTVTSGSASSALSLNAGLNSITVLVTAQDGTTTKSYTIAVTRALNSWTGGTSTDFSNPLNWSGGTVPTVADDIIINSSSNNPQITGTQSVGSLTINSGASLTVTGTLKIGGSISNSGTLTATSGTVEFNGSSAQSIPANAFASNTLQNLTINNSAGVSLGGTLTVTGVLTPTAGTLNTGGNLTLASTATGTASIAAGSGTYISGNVTTQRYTRAQRGYRTLGHPFNTAQNLGILTDNFRITGLTTNVGSGTYATSTGNPSAFLYDPTQTIGSTSVLTRLTDATANIWGVGKGLYVFVRGAGNEGMGGAGASNYSTLNPVTIDGTGAINQGDVTVNLIYGGVGKDNYNLIGNPYPCPINLKTVTGISSYGTVYVYNPVKNIAGSDQYNVSGGFDQYTNDGGTDIIVPVFGAFYIQATGNGQSLTFKESDKAVGSTPSYTVFGTEKNPRVRLQITNTNGEIDELKLGINSSSSDASTDKYDATKLGNSLFNFYSLSSDRKALAIDYRANLNSTIPLGIQTNLANHYKISLSELTDLPNTQLVLRDKLLNKETILTQVDDAYSFDITADTATKGENRFEIGLLGTTVLPVQIADITAQLQANKTVAVNWTSTTEVNLAKYNVQRSKDGSNFSTVGTVAAKGASIYSYNDDLSTAGVLPATIYYRLEAVDKDGSKTFSKVASCQLSVASKSISIYPNPVQATLYAQVTVTKAGAAQLRVVDAQGKVVATQKKQLGVGTTSVSIPAVQLAAGNYVLEIDSADGKQTQRFVKE